MVLSSSQPSVNFAPWFPANVGDFALVVRLVFADCRRSSARLPRTWCADPAAWGRTSCRARKTCPRSRPGASGENQPVSQEIQGRGFPLCDFVSPAKVVLCLPFLRRHISSKRGAFRSTTVVVVRLCPISWEIWLNCQSPQRKTIRCSTSCGSTQLSCGNSKSN